jgi:hypothetical protein
VPVDQRGAEDNFESVGRDDPEKSVPPQVLIDCSSFRSLTPRESTALAGRKWIASKEAVDDISTVGDRFARNKQHLSTSEPACPAVSKTSARPDGTPLALGPDDFAEWVSKRRAIAVDESTAGKRWLC